MSFIFRFIFRVSKTLHKYFGLLLLIYLLPMGLSGLLLNNPGPISSLSVPWAVTPDNYQPRNWNRMYLRAGTIIGDDWFLAGKPGVVHSPDGGRTFTMLDQGFPATPYRRDTLGLLVLPPPPGAETASPQVEGNQGPALELLAATRSGLYHQPPRQPWQAVELPGARGEAVVDIVATDRELVAFTRSGAYRSPLPAHDRPSGAAPSAAKGTYRFTAADLAAAPTTQPRPVPWFRILHDMHNGDIIGPAGKWLLDLVAVALIFLSLSALVIWYVPWRSRWLKKWRRRPGRVFTFCWPWHLKIGVYAMAFLVILGVSGALVRPPLLIALAPYSLSQDHPLLAFSPRSDDFGGNIQKALYLSDSDQILLATQGGFFQGPADFSHPFSPRRVPVPIHGMGVTVLAEMEPGMILVGSFMGLYLWEEASGRTQRLPRPGLVGGNPYMSNDLLSAVVMEQVPAGAGTGQWPRFRVDYHDGLMATDPRDYRRPPPMPAEIGRDTPMSLWHWLFELHNGRIFEKWLGMSYMLIVPIGGVGLLLLSLTGLYDWFYRRKRS
ncbi:PepSY-associated TM helix domain-containing protein [Desulfurivibrio alkaliphilus]|uniref:PepSY-associated TM helix domain protein n=1 Tax=Desulfurivibrio alkaliphilus (strain DSM 19089 / UNIQEM U267 / AHT2) TaxID=589865 RepID=D6Z6T5_DESAT|nr:PepSY-associated TM helix domain-containing protein [Desulfurivibrio alkaliphilus]ADH85044.1 PepSY-associated TM helix domain protein [Desulfurivibrio alkaliphilus AHT 2]